MKNNRFNLLFLALYQRMKVQRPCKSLWKEKNIYQWSKLALARQPKSSRFSLGLVKIPNVLARLASMIQIVENSLYFNFQFVNKLCSRLFH